ncbi:MAG: sulfotransferase [Pseudomonadota bacterium]|nr:sulfotransferase [Pseudomonadota bacterium]
MTTTETIMARVEELYGAGRRDEAKALLLEIIAGEPNHKEALNNLGVIHFEEGDAGKATDFFLKALSADPYDRNALLNLADALRFRGQLPAIASLIKKQVAKDPRDRELRAILDETYLLSRQETDKQFFREAGEPFFVLSTGNCGTATLAEALRTATNARIHHRPDNVLEENLLACYQGREDRRKVFYASRRKLMEAAWREGAIYGETTPATAFFSDLLARDLPRAKFVVLVRDPLSFVSSSLHRNFYQGHRDDGFRLKPSSEDRDYPEWKELSQAEKICRLWTDIYQGILTGLEAVDPGRVTILHLEDLAAGAKIIEQIFDFLGLSGFQAEVIAPILQTRLNAAAYGRFPGSGDWSSEMRRRLLDLCGPVAERLGYGPETTDDPSSGAAAHSPTPAPTPPPAKRPPKVTIGLLLYSGGAMLSQSLESILGQDCGDFEVIVSDHGSDPFVAEVGRHYERLDRRIRYIDSGDRQGYLGINNFARMIELSESPYFMWGSYDDRIETEFLRRCLETIEQDDSIALVYPRSRVYNERGDYVGLGNDVLKADGDDPYDRFLHVIWELNMCNAFYGVFRRQIMRKTRSLRMTTCFSLRSPCWAGSFRSRMSCSSVILPGITT